MAAFSVLAGGQLSVAVGSAASPPPPPPPRRSPRCRGWQAVTDDAKEAALGMVDVGTLAKLKGVNHSWSALRGACSAPTSSAARVSPRQVSG